MKRAALLAGVLLLAFPPALGAQSLRVEGLVVNGTTGRPAAKGTRVEIAVVGRDGSRVDAARTTLDEKGRFSQDVEFTTGARAVVSTRFAGITYSTIARAGTGSGYAELRVFETTRDPKVVAVSADTTVAEVAGAEEVEVLQIVRVTNSSNRTFVGANHGSATFRLPLPAGATDVAVVEGLTPGREDASAGVLEAGDPLQPGDSTISYAYKLSGDGAWDLERESFYPTVRMDVLVEPGMELSGGGFRLLGEIDFGGDSYRQYVRNDIAAGRTITVTMRRATGTGPWPFAAGAAALVLLAALVWRAGRARASGRRRTAPETAAGRDRERLIESIAALDLAHDSGNVDAEEYAARRAALKEQLEHQRT